MTRKDNKVHLDVGNGIDSSVVFQQAREILYCIPISFTPAAANSVRTGWCQL